VSLHIAQGCVSTVSLWWIPSSNGQVDTERDGYGNHAAAFTYRSSIDSDITIDQAGWAIPAPKRLVSERWHSVCAGSRRFKAFRKEKVCLEWSEMTRSRAIWSGYSWFRGVPGVGSYVNNEWLLVKIGRWIEYACGVKSETINLDRWVNFRCTWASFLSEEILGCIHRVILEYASCISGYNLSTRYCSDRLSIPGWVEIYCTGSVSGESRSWQRYSCAIDCKLLNIDDSVNIPNPFVTLVSGAPEIDPNKELESNLEVQVYLKTQISFADFRIKIPRTLYDEDEQWLQLDRFSHREIYGSTKFHLVHR